MAPAVRWAAGLAVVCVAFAVVACDSDDATPASEVGADATPDAAPSPSDAAADVSADVPPAASFEITLGTGRETHVPVADGDTMYLELGHQGLQHVLVSVVATVLEQDRYLTAFTLVRDDGVEGVTPVSVNVPYVALPDASGAMLTGYQLVVLEPDLVVGEDFVLTVAVTGPDGGVATDSRGVHVEWAPGDWDPDAR